MHRISCGKCGEQFADERQDVVLRRHRYHTCYYCRRCRLVYDTQDLLVSHIRAVHGPVSTDAGASIPLPR
jgi:hypothetical protein